MRSPSIRCTKAAESLSRLIATVTRSMHEQTSATNEVAAAVSSMRKEGEQASRALAEQARAMRDVLSNSQNITKQIDLITKANKQHSSRAGHVLTQLKDVRVDHGAQRAFGPRYSGRDRGSPPACRSAGWRADAAEERIQRPIMNRIGILTTDTELVVTTWDATLEQMTGIPADRARGHRLEEIVPDLRSRMLIDLIREPLISGSAQVLAPALHKYLIPCPPLEPSDEFDHMQQRVVVGALRDAHRSVGLVMSIEDVTERLERERELARQLRDQSPSARLKAVEQLAHEPADGIGPLGVAMGDEDWRVRRAAVKALAARRDEALVDGVIAALRDGHRDFSVLSSALQLLTLTGVDSTKALVRLIDDADADLRIQAALALGSQRHPEATEALLRALDDTDPNVRFHAIESLGKLASPAAIDKLAAIAESRDFYLAFPAIEALVRINDPVIAPRIAPLLSDPMLSAAAAEALGHIGDEDAIAPLVDALAEPATSVDAVVEALTRIQHRYETSTSDGEEMKELVRRRLSPEGMRRILASLEHASSKSVRALISVVGWLRDPAVPSALVRLLGAEEARHDVVEAFVRVGFVRSTAVDRTAGARRSATRDALRSSHLDA